MLLTAESNLADSDWQPLGKHRPKEYATVQKCVNQHLRLTIYQTKPEFDESFF
jgi:hypothetical protein